MVFLSVWVMYDCIAPMISGRKKSTVAPRTPNFQNDTFIFLIRLGSFQTKKHRNSYNKTLSVFRRRRKKKKMGEGLEPFPDSSSSPGATFLCDLKMRHSLVRRRSVLTLYAFPASKEEEDACVATRRRITIATGRVFGT